MILRGDGRPEGLLNGGVRDAMQLAVLYIVELMHDFNF